jgi:formate dehydrogenase subunit delta
MELKMETRDMVRMANQIATFFKSYGEDEAVEGIAEHINKFWETRMRRDFFAYIETGGEGLEPLVMKAAEFVKRPKQAA